MTRKLDFTEQPQPNGDTLLRWSERGKQQYPLDFWYVPPWLPLSEARAQVERGELD